METGNNNDTTTHTRVNIKVSFDINPVGDQTQNLRDGDGEPPQKLMCKINKVS